MIAFVTTLRHPDNCRSYERVGRLLEATLRSVCRQTDDDFRVVVVHNALPAVEYSNPLISYVKVDFPAPSSERTARIPFNVFMRDKGTKCVIGVVAARELEADYVMFIDADDYLHRGIASFVNEQRGHPGWYSPQGLIHTKGSRAIQPVPTDFHLKNGSTGIIRTDLTGVPVSLSTVSTQDEIVGALTGAHVDRMFGKHGAWQTYLGEMGYDMEPLPFPAAVWEIGTGENVSGNLVSGRRGQPLSAEITEYFGLTLPSLPSRVVTSVTLTAQRLGRKLSKVTGRTHP